MKKNKKGGGIKQLISEDDKIFLYIDVNNDEWIICLFYTKVKQQFIYFINLIYQLNNNLSTVVLTQNILWAIIPNKNNKNNVFAKLVLNVLLIINATIIVATTSTIATSKILYLWEPVFGAPNISLYLHKSI